MPHPASQWPVQELSVEERIALLGKVWDSLLSEGSIPTPDWHLQEVRQRIAEADAHPEASIPLEQLKRELRGEQL